MLFIFLLYHQFISAQNEQDLTILVLNQSNAHSMYPNVANKVMCQKIIDRPDYPLILGSDDIILPDQLEWQSKWGIHTCHAMRISFTTIRTRNDLNPYNITICLFRNNPTKNQPWTPFYKRTLKWPTNNPHWVEDAISLPSQNTIVLEQGDLDDNGETIFDLQNPDFLQLGSRMWVSFYVTMPWHLGQSLRTNSMYWVTLDNATGSSLPQEFSEENSHFFYRDEEDLEKHGFVNWTDGEAVSPYLGIRATTNQMAWTLSLNCRGIPLPPTIEPMPVTEVPFTKEVTESPSFIKENETNQSVAGDNHFKEALIIGSLGTLLPILLIVVIVSVVVGFLYAKRRKRRQVMADNINQRLNGLKDYTAIPLNPLSPGNLEERRIFTDGNQFRDVPLNDTKYPDLFQNGQVNTTDDDMF